MVYLFCKMGSDSEDENPQEARRRRKKEKAERVSEEKGKAPQKAQGYNYWAIGILALFALPLLLTGILKVVCVLMGILIDLSALLLIDIRYDVS